MKKRVLNEIIKIIETYNLYEFDKFTKKDLKRGKIEKPKKRNTKPKKSILEYYQVKKGDTLYSIARKFNTTVAILKKLNALTTNSLSIGQQLVIN